MVLPSRSTVSGLAAAKRGLLGLASSVAVLASVGCSDNSESAAGLSTTQNIKQITIESRVKPTLSIEGLTFRDLNNSGELDPYEDWRLSAAERAADLVSRMTLAEKAGAMLHGSLRNLPPKSDSAVSLGYDLEAYTQLVRNHHVNSFISRFSSSPETLAQQSNALQAIAEGERLGIPLTISTDPRNHFQYVLGASSEAVDFSQWPEPLGFAALRDTDRVTEFADIVRQEYRAVGMHMALSPQADLATEPRWPRQVATFGSQPELVSKLAGAYVAGFQGSPEGLTQDGVITITKHWVGYGAAVDGFDGHNYYGRFANVDADTLRAHIDAFDGALAAQTAGIMPTYSVPQGGSLNGEPLEQVGAGFSRQLLTDLLRNEWGYKGLLLSDWAITRDCPEACVAPTVENPQGYTAIATPWGMEDKTGYDRYVKGINAGLDQFGGEDNPAPLIEAVNKGDVQESRLNESVQRIMQLKFALGLFDNPYVDPDRAKAVVGSSAFREKAMQAQREAQVLLQNTDQLLPLASDLKKVFLYGMSADVAAANGYTVVADPEQADVAIVRTSTPAEKLHPYHFFGSRQNEGRLNFTEEDEVYQLLSQLQGKVPTVLAIFLDRPAILTNLQDKTTAIVGNFGASDQAVLDVLSGRAEPKGKLPFELPSSRVAVAEQHPAVPDDSASPLYPYGFGLSF